MTQFGRSKGNIFPAPGARTSAWKDSECAFFSPPEQPHFTIVHSHLHSFFLHSEISPLFHLHAQCEDHSSKTKKEKHRRCWRRRTQNTSPTQHHDSLQLHKCVIFPITSTLPELSLTISSCVHSSTSCSKQNTCQRTLAVGARVYVLNSSS